MSYENIKIAITGGGTGGHIFPALAVIEYFQQKGFNRFLYIGGTKGLENKIIPEKGIPYKKIWISGFDRSNMLKNITFPFKLMVSFLQSLTILLRFNPDIVIGFGGYVSGPVIFTASSILIPTMIMEQDVYPGITTRIAARWAKRILVAFEESKAFFSNKQQMRTRVAGNPVRPSLAPIDKEEARRKLGLQPNMFTVLVMGGSQGAKAINDVILKNLHRLQEEDLQIIWQTGHKNYEEVNQQLQSKNVKNFLVRPFFDEMSAVYSAADVVVNRAGALTIAELLKMQKPSILIPYPYAAGDHQRKNAEAMEKRGVAVMLDQNESEFEDKLMKLLVKFKNETEWRKSFLQNLTRYSENNALEIIFDNAVDLLATKL